MNNCIIFGAIKSSLYTNIRTMGSKVKNRLETNLTSKSLFFLLPRRESPVFHFRLIPVALGLASILPSERIKNLKQNAFDMK